MISAASELALASNREQLSHAEENAKAWSESIAAAHEAWQFCTEEGEGKYLSAEAKACLKEHGYDGTNHDVVAEWIEDAMREAALSVDVRCSDWQSPSDRDFTPNEFQVLISTGGPALRLIGELINGEPSRCWFEHQDWGTPWSRYFDQYGDARLWFASLFYWEA
jgi:hypothetical protein